MTDPDATVGGEAATRRAARMLGPHRVTGHIGAGGMGEVLRAIDDELQREVAVKVIRGRAGPEATERFLLEARLTGQLEHPNIVPVHALGQAGDRGYYFTMKEVRGRDLQAALDAGELSLARRLEVLLKVCDAISYAHSRQVIHRDLKPQNIMVGAHGEVLVMDWGLAKIVGTGELPGGIDPSLAGATGTLDGTVVGTPAYMAPEQARGEVETLDQRADVYALGAVLRHLVTGSPPYAGESAWDVLEQVRAGPPPALPEGTPWELAAIVGRAMAREADDRYASAGALRDDVDRYLRGGMVGAARYGPWLRLTRWAARHSARVTAAAAVLLLGLVGASIAVVTTNRAFSREQAARRAAHRSGVAAEKARVAEREGRRRMQEALRATRVNLAQALLYKAEVATRERRTLEAMAYVDAARALHESTESWLTGLRLERPRWLPDRAVASGVKTTRLVAPLDGAWFAVCGPTVSVRDGVSGAERSRFEVGGVRAAYAAGAGDQLAIGGVGEVVLVDGRSGRARVLVEGLEGPVRTLAFRPDGRVLAVGIRGLAAGAPTSRCVRLVDTRNGAVLRTLPLDGDPWRLSWSPDGRMLAVASNDHPASVVVFEPEGEREPVCIAAEGRSIVGLQLVGDELVVGMRDGQLAIADASRGAVRSMRPGVGAPMEEMAAPRGKGEGVLAWGRGLVRVRHRGSHELVQSIDGQSACRGPGGTIWVCAGQTLWRYVRADGLTRRAQPIALRSGNLPRLAMCPDGRRLAVATGAEVRLWSAPDGRLLTALSGCRAGVAFHPDGRVVAALGDDGDVILWDLERRRRVGRLAGWVQQDLRYGRDGGLAALTIDGVKVWSSGSESGRVLASGGRASALAFGGATRIACGRSDGRIALWVDGVRRELSGHRGEVIALAFHPDGRQLASVGADRALRVWSIAGGEARAQFDLGCRGVGLAYRPDGRLLCVGTNVGRLFLMSADGQRFVGQVDPANGWFSGVAWSPDGRWLASASGDARLRAFGIDVPPRGAAPAITGYRRDGSRLARLAPADFAARRAATTWRPTAGWRRDVALMCVDQARRAVRQGRFAAAQDLLDRALREAPDEPGTHLLRAEVRSRLGDQAGAIADLDRALASDAGLQQAYRMRAVVHRLAGRLDAALRDATRALRISPRSWRARVERARVWEARREHRRVIEEMDIALAHVAAVAAFRLRGDAYLALDNRRRALVDYHEVLKRTPRDWRTLARAGHVHASLGEVAKARGLLARARQLAPPAERPAIDRLLGTLAK